MSGSQALPWGGKGAPPHVGVGLYGGPPEVPGPPKPELKQWTTSKTCVQSRAGHEQGLGLAPLGVLCMGKLSLSLFRLRLPVSPSQAKSALAGPCSWLSSLLPTRSGPRSVPFLPTLERGQSQGSRGQEPVVPGGAAAPSPF